MTLLRNSLDSLFESLNHRLINTFQNPDSLTTQLNFKRLKPLLSQQSLNIPHFLRIHIYSLTQVPADVTFSE